MWGYKEVYVSNDSNRRPNGCVLAHVLVAEQKLGRKLEAKETVHHVDENRGNNKPENIMVFKTKSDHARYHKTGNAHLLSDGTYVAPKVNTACHVCGTRHSNKYYCSRYCSNIANRKVIRPDKESLLQLIKKYSFVRIGKMFGVTDNAVRKWCKQYGLSYKKMRGE